MKANYIDVSWTTGYQAVISAEDALAALNEILAETGEIAAEEVVDRAKPKTHPLHPEIYRESEREAAHQWRLYRSRNMVRAIHVVEKAAPKLKRRAFEVTTQPTEEKPRRRVYMTTEQILRDPVRRDELLVNAFRDAAAFRRRYRDLQECAAIHQAIDHVLESA